MLAFQIRHVFRIDVGRTVVDDITNVLGMLQWIRELWEQTRFQEDGFGVSLAKRVLQSLFSEGIVCGHDRH